jgi:hypothetical protein
MTATTPTVIARNEANNDVDLFPVNALASYSKLKEVINELIEDLNDVDQQEYNTRSARLQIDHIRNIIYKMDKMIMSRPHPWEYIGISRSTYYRNKATRDNDE